MASTVEELLNRKRGMTRVELSGGASVVVRGMTRAEAADMRKLDQDDVLGLEAFGLATCLVEPAMTVAQAKEWLQVEESAEIAKIIRAIEVHNGTAEGQAKGYTKSVSRRG